jgi:hypothetical protein
VNLFPDNLDDTLCTLLAKKKEQLQQKSDPVSSSNRAGSKERKEAETVMGKDTRGFDPGSENEFQFTVGVHGLCVENLRYVESVPGLLKCLQQVRDGNEWKPSGDKVAMVDCDFMGDCLNISSMKVLKDMLQDVQNG